MKLSLAQKYIAGSCLVSVLLAPVFAFAKLTKASDKSSYVAVVDLAEEDIAILPGNPFHPVLGMMSGIRGWFISDRAQDANFRLTLAGRRAGEVRKLLDFASTKTELINKALAHYSGSLTEFENRLKKVKADDVSSEEGQQILTEMTSRLLIQIRFAAELNELLTKGVDTAMLETIEKTLWSSLEIIASRLEDSKSFTDRVVSIIAPAENPAIALQYAAILNTAMLELAGDEEMAEFVSQLQEIHARLLEGATEAL